MRPQSLADIPYGSGTPAAALPLPAASQLTKAPFFSHLSRPLPPLHFSTHNTQHTRSSTPARPSPA